jgi:hypothetical protein
MEMRLFWDLNINFLSLSKGHQQEYDRAYIYIYIYINRRRRGGSEYYLVVESIEGFTREQLLVLW